jgi:hypothetical protein
MYSKHYIEHLTLFLDLSWSGLLIKGTGIYNWETIPVFIQKNGSENHDFLRQ